MAGDDAMASTLRRGDVHRSLVPGKLAVVKIQRLAVLFGAGASFGAGQVSPQPPPLGGQLFAILRDEFPASWGRLPPSVQTQFASDFETAMVQIWEAETLGGTRLLIDMALYFTRFDPADDNSDLYGELIRTLVQNRCLRKTAFATLNYELIFDISLSRHGFRVSNLRPEPGTPADRSVVVWKPHGACNLLPTSEIYGGVLVATDLYEGELQAHDLPAVQEKYRRGFSLPPAMSLYAPGKPSPVAKHFTDLSRQQWATWVSDSDLIISIGVRPTLADSHIWDPILHSAAPLWFIGGTSGGDQADYDALSAAAGERLEPLGPFFDSGLIEIKRRLPQM